jgi:hypothetical protein
VSLLLSLSEIILSHNSKRAIFVPIPIHKSDSDEVKSPDKLLNFSAKKERSGLKVKSILR